ncbi:hypothetical protein I6F35_10890 [Bradyrhizobium sp. BRP22]|uniref:hypothetical protein n=1 Tax=Bradyrhizobium sp. BRP22 TaxID=2793821 RepID=UPI001CD81072|nr:hypothetical protein [Bradyrhizobium sp. BRP22]MCA1453717.1 hypothetical protein [Bradyrhizobium sp. BRP22]
MRDVDAGRTCEAFVPQVSVLVEMPSDLNPIERATRAATAFASHRAVRQSEGSRVLADKSVHHEHQAYRKRVHQVCARMSATITTGSEHFSVKRNRQPIKLFSHMPTAPGLGRKGRSQLWHFTPSPEFS